MGFAAIVTCVAAGVLGILALTGRAIDKTADLAESAEEQCSKVAKRK